MIAKVIAAALAVGIAGYGYFRWSAPGETAAESKIGTIREADFQKQVLESSLPVVADFYAPWCGPCRMLAPTLDEVAAAYDGKVRFVKINVDDDPALAGKYGVQGVPTLLFFKSGRPASSSVGIQSKESLTSQLDRLIGSTPPASA